MAGFNCWCSCCWGSSWGCFVLLGGCWSSGSWGGLLVVITFGSWSSWSRGGFGWGSWRCWGWGSLSGGSWSWSWGSLSRGGWSGWGRSSRSWGGRSSTSVAVVSFEN